MDKLRTNEKLAGCYGLWGHLQIDASCATHAERLFATVHETRRCCKTCSMVRVWYAMAYMWPVRAAVIAGGVQTLAEAYIKSCGPGVDEVHCPGCSATTAHTVQARVMTQPNVFIVQIQRRLGAPRVPIAVEEQLELPCWSTMDLVGVIYHNGPSPDSGHYTCACRLADGTHSLFDDNSSAVALTDEVGHVNQRLATLAVYCRLGGSFECTSSAAAAAATPASVGISVNDGVAIDGIAPSTASGSVGAPPQLGASDAFAGERPLLRRLSRKTSATSDRSKTSVSAAPPSILLQEVTAPRRSLKRNSNGRRVERVRGFKYSFCEFCCRCLASSSHFSENVFA